VLIAEGMAAWMRAWHEPLCCSVAAAAPEAEALSMSLGESWQQEATRLLVNMALSHLVILCLSGCFSLSDLDSHILCQFRSASQYLGLC
jgi:hypothetical protein